MKFYFGVVQFLYSTLSINSRGAFYDYAYTYGYPFKNTCLYPYVRGRVLGMLDRLCVEELFISGSSRYVRLGCLYGCLFLQANCVVMSKIIYRIGFNSPTNLLISNV